MAKNYTYQGFKKENMARATGFSLPISTKQSIEICNYLRKKKTSYAKRILEGVVETKTPIPFKRFNGDVGHKAKIGPGRYPAKASKEILKVIMSVEANAQFKGLDSDSLIIESINANKASTPWRYGRQRGRKSKRTHIEVVVKEVAGKIKENTKKPTKVEKQAVQKKETKQEIKKEQPKQQVKEQETPKKTQDTKEQKSPVQEKKVDKK